MSTTTGDPTVSEVLAATSDEALLNTFASLTHQIHGLSENVGEARMIAALREQRLVVRAEILRRMGGPR